MRVYVRRKGNGRGVCELCNRYPCMLKGHYKDGSPRYSGHCHSCHIRKYWGNSRNLKLYSKVLDIALAKNKCVMCGFIPEHSCQMDIDHIDGNRDNYARDNLQVICSNCHRLKTYHCRDWESKNL